MQTSVLLLCITKYVQFRRKGAKLTALFHDLEKKKIVVACLCNKAPTLGGKAPEVVSFNKYLDVQEEFKNLRIFTIIVEGDVANNESLKFIFWCHFSEPSDDYKQRTALKHYHSGYYKTVALMGMYPSSFKKKR